MRLPVDETGEADAVIPDRARTGWLQIRLPQVRGGRRSAAAHPLEAGAMKWVDDLKVRKENYQDKIVPNGDVLYGIISGAREK